MSKQLIINADDLGICKETNVAIQRAFCDGILTSASLMPNMAAAEHAVEHVIGPNPQLGIGVHLCLTSGKPVLPASRVPSLVNRDGEFRHGFLGLLRLLRSRQRCEVLQQITDELDAQMDRACRLGVIPDHVNGHQHVHMIPGIFEHVLAHARRNGLAVRVSDERVQSGGRSLGGLLYWLRGAGVLKRFVLSQMLVGREAMIETVTRTDHYRGLLDSGRVNERTFQEIVRSLPVGVTELNVHPGLRSPRISPGSCSQADVRFLKSRYRQVELNALLNPTIRAEIRSAKIQLARFHNLVAHRVSTHNDKKPLAPTLYGK